MQPNNQQIPEDPFAFITNAGQTHKPSLLQPGSKKGRIIIALVGLVLLITVFAIIMSFLNNSSEGKTKQYIELGQQQTELIRLSAVAQQKSKSLETRSYASTIKLSMTSSQSTMNDLIQSHGVSARDLSAQLTNSKNAKSDTILDEAEKNGRFDTTFRELINSQLLNYQKQLSALASSSSAKEKTILQEAFNQAQIINTSNATN